MSQASESYILTLSCVDKPGIVAAVTREIAALGANISESSQFGDPATKRFFMRIAFDATRGLTKSEVERALQPAIEQFDISCQVTDASRKAKLIIMVSKFDHALLHLLYQVRVNWLHAEVVAVVSNHEDSRATAEHEGIPYLCWKVSKENKAEQEAKLIDLFETSGADLIVLARYMQILSDDLSKRLSGRLINIHHSFLPSFKGAKPYNQAFERGVKLIGATAHYVTAELDEGPIIEQETERVSHAMSVDDFVAAGRNIESRVLARAVKSHLESRVLMNERKTVVFS